MAASSFPVEDFDDILRYPATILDYETIYNISCDLCNQAALTNWKHVAGKLGYDQKRIYGDFANYDGCGPGERMLVDFIQIKQGAIGQLLQVFEELELLTCKDEIETFLRSKQEKNKTHPVEDNENDQSGGGGVTSLPSQASESDFEENLDTLKGSIGSPGDLQIWRKREEQHMTSETEIFLNSTNERAVSERLCNNGMSEIPDLRGLQVSTEVDTKDSSDGRQLVECGTNNQCKHKKIDCNDSAFERHSAPTTPLAPRKESTGELHASDKPPPFISYLPYPIERAISVPGNQSASKIKGFPKIFKRSTSEDSSLKKNKKKLKLFYLKNIHIPLKKKNKQRVQMSPDKMPGLQACSSSVTTDTVEGYYAENKEEEAWNNSPLKPGRPPSSSSEESGTPCSPTSLGYDTGYSSCSPGTSPTPEKIRTDPLKISKFTQECNGFHVDKKENYEINIFIICASDMLEGACNIYLEFAKKGYKCHMSQVDCREFHSHGNRYVYGQFCSADFVFLCVSKMLFETFEASMQAQTKMEGEERTLRFASDLILGDLGSKGCNENGKFMTILPLAGDSKKFVPKMMQNYVKYRWPEDEHKMENTIHSRPEIRMTPLSQIQRAPLQKLVTASGVKIPLPSL